MFSAASASKRFAKLNQDYEILMWRYATEPSDTKRQVLGLRVMNLKLKQSLLGAFYKATLNVDMDDAEGRRLKNAITHASALSPSESVGRALLMKKTMADWEEARERNDFSLVEESLQDLVNSIRKEAQYKAEQMGLDSPYEALLQSKTPGFSAAEFEEWSAALERFCGSVLAALPEGRAKQQASDMCMEKEIQCELQDAMLEKMGYDFERGWIDEAPHPFCFGMHDDVRIGMRYSEEDFSEFLMTVFHEGGHALYRQGLPQERKNILLGQLAGVGMDEAMALLMENHAGRSREFAGYIANYISENLQGHHGDSVTGQKVYDHLTSISAEPIRTEADEIRYPLDVILRYKVEKALIDDGLAVSDIPSFWAQEYERLTGMPVYHDNDGALQDIHWFGGEFGWFPNYLVGQLAAAQLFEKACIDKPGIKTDMANGNFDSLREWLHENVYSKGAEYTTFELVENITGHPLDVEAYKRHIDDRYLRPLRAPEPPHAPRPDLP